ncbi:hypothetical protein VM1G_10761 [Cytospora mali]|uniref:Rhodopsin domain-containing protein n=1 Tax=Cytospora mali TaxID=578113 RepID=A0A194VJ03_CYTMA|nr:hypothetical protein VM1G_10761 [Valsa mali]
MAYVAFPMPNDVRAYLVANCIVQLIVILVVAGRIVSRRLRRVKLSLDDYLIIVAVPQALTLVILQGLTSTLGSGYHLSSAIMPNLEFILKLNFTFELIYLAVLGTIKMSILSFYLRLFSRGTRMHQLTQFAMFVVGLWVCMHAEAVFMVCQPIQMNWDVTAEGVCGDQIKLFESIIITNIIVDALIWSMPLYTVWNLQVRKSDKVGLTACFLIGLAVIIAAIARVIYVTSVDIIGDITGTMALTVFLAAFEPGLAIICACIPMLRPLWAEFRGYVSTMRHSTALTEDEDPSKSRHGNELNNITSSFGHRSTSKAVEAAHEEEERRLRASSTGGNLWQTSPSAGGGALDDGERGTAIGLRFGVTAPLDAVRTPGRGTKAGAADYDDASLESGSEWDLMPGLRAPPARMRLNSKSKWTISRG